MAPKVTGLFFGIGFAGWVYYQMMRRSGGNTKNSLIVAVSAGLVGFFVVTSLLSMIFPEE